MKIKKILIFIINLKNIIEYNLSSAQKLEEKAKANLH